MFVPGVCICVKLSILNTPAGVLGVVFNMALSFPRKELICPDGPVGLVWAG